MLAWVAFASLWYGRSVWTVPNLLASTFYGEPALRRHFGLPTVSGLALHVCIYGVVGAGFGLLVRDRFSVARTVVLAVLWAVAWYYFSFGIFWKHVNPLVILYVHDRPMLVGHLLYGALLGAFPEYLRRLTATAETVSLLRS